MNNLRYMLEPYKGLKSRYKCPSCGQKEFTRYIDTRTGSHLHDDAGRCNREQKCGYHYKPRDYFKDYPAHPDMAGARFQRGPCPGKTEPSFIGKELLVRSVMNKADNYFIKYLCMLFGPNPAADLVFKYYIGTSKYWKGASVFWYADINDKLRTGKIMLYDPKTGKRVKEPYNHITWVHSVLKLQDFNAVPCLFGERLLNLYPEKPVCIVESEKTAVIASVYNPHFNWLATGGMSNISAKRFSVLQGRDVTLYPDAGAYDKWKAKARELSHITSFRVSRFLENRGEKGMDLGDCFKD